MIGRKTLSTVGTIGVIVSPVAMVLSCGSSNLGVTMKDIEGTLTTGYADSIGKVALGTLSLAGGYSDLRANIRDGGDEKVSVLGVVHKRIANDGLQARSDMKPADQKAFQIIFKQLVRLSADESSLQVLLDGEVKSLFKVYSHNDYTSLDKNTKITYLEDGVAKEANALKGEAPEISASPADDDSDYFSVTNLNALRLLTSTSTISDVKNALSTTKARFSVQMIPSKNPTDVQSVAVALKSFFDNATGKDNPIAASANYSVAARQLESRQIDLAFLPVDTWATIAPSTNFLLQASRSTIVGTMIQEGNTLKKPTSTIGDSSIAVQALDKFGSLYLSDLKDIDPNTLSGESDFVDRAPKFPSWEANFNAAVTNTNDPLHDFVLAALFARHTYTDRTNDIYKAGSYESVIYGKTDSEITRKISEAVKAKSNFSMPLSDLGTVTYGYTSITSSSSYLFPELWFNSHFTK
ncbi:hypothetical protein [Candidatus Mycoplasma mahonii]|uniref:hypothetical protein n=1 Tax=Candidatus Mycoplasma mahonii TaxID=3004105 RepID=UPI0026ED8603|nr:hypothetical protein [Candidatus Mycoplasma mahonii]WKX02462.1 hypothetical protein O3I44_00050 [Candidatus Mycoplasma mahonii]